MVVLLVNANCCWINKLVSLLSLIWRLTCSSPSPCLFRGEPEIPHNTPKRAADHAHLPVAMATQHRTGGQQTPPPRVKSQQPWGGGQGPGRRSDSLTRTERERLGLSRSHFAGPEQPHVHDSQGNANSVGPTVAKTWPHRTFASNPTKGQGSWVEAMGVHWCTECHQNLYLKIFTGPDMESLEVKAILGYIERWGQPGLLRPFLKKKKMFMILPE